MTTLPTRQQIDRDDHTGRADRDALPHQHDRDERREAQGRDRAGDDDQIQERERQGVRLQDPKANRRARFRRGDRLELVGDQGEHDEAWERQPRGRVQSVALRERRDDHRRERHPDRSAGDVGRHAEAALPVTETMDDGGAGWVEGRAPQGPACLKFLAAQPTGGPSR
mgnify:CR=1 FL=1